MAEDVTTAVARLRALMQPKAPDDCTMTDATDDVVAVLDALDAAQAKLTWSSEIIKAQQERLDQQAPDQVQLRELLDAAQAEIAQLQEVNETNASLRSKWTEASKQARQAEALAHQLAQALRETREFIGGDNANPAMLRVIDRALLQPGWGR